MPRLILGALVAALLSVPSTAAAAPCPGAADPCPYSSAAVIGQRAEGVLRFPQATAVGPDGSVYVADQYTHAVQVFGPDGTFRSELGAAGSGPGGLSSVGGVAVGPDGSVYVADGADRIDRFAPDGRVLNSWGTSGSAPGQFNFGSGVGNASGAGGGIAVGADGLVYVADTRNDRIQRFAADGTQPVVIVPPGRVKRPQGLAVSGSRLIVADDLNHRLAVFDTGGRFLTAVGRGEGPEPGQFQNPYDVAVDGSGRIYVADNSNHRVTRFGPAPGYLYRARWGAFGAGRGQLQYPRGIAADASGRTFVADPGGNRVDMFDAGGKSLGSFGASGRAAGQFIRPLGVGADGSGIRAVTDTVNGRVVLLNPDNSVAAMFGAPAPGPTLLPAPVDVAFDAAGLVYVLDQRRGRVIVFNRKGTIVRTIGSSGSGPGKLRDPSAVAVSAGGTVYVADTGNKRIVRYTTAGAHLGSFGRFRTVNGVAVSPDGLRVYALDSAAGKIMISSATGGDVGEIGLGNGRRPGQFRQAAGIAVDAAGNVWVADRGNDRIQAFSPDGTPLLSFGELGVGAGQFVDPTDVAVDCRGVVTVADANNNRVQAFQVAPVGVCGALPPVVNPPEPILYNQPAPLPPQLTVTPLRTARVLATRSFPVRVNCDLPCRATVSVTLRTRSGGKVSATLRATKQLPAGKTVTLKPRLSAAGAAKLRNALHGKRGLTAEVSVRATTTDSPPGTLTRKLNVTA